MSENKRDENSTPIPPLQLKCEPEISDFDVMLIYKDVSKVGAIERRLNILYRPFTCSINTKCCYDLRELDAFLLKSFYEPNKREVLYVRQTNPLCCLKVYGDGNVSCQSHSYQSAALGLRQFMDTCKRMGYSPNKTNPKYNVVSATFCMPFSIDLVAFKKNFSASCRYDPEAQPYLMYMINESIIKFAIFPSGYVYVLLASNQYYTQMAIAYIMPLLYLHASEVTNEIELSSGDINSKLLWEHEFQMAYQYVHDEKYHQLKL